MNIEHYKRDVWKIAEAIGDSELYRLEDSCNWIENTNADIQHISSVARNVREKLELGVTLLKLLENKLDMVRIDGGFSPIPELPEAMNELFCAVKIGDELWSDIDWKDEVEMSHYEPMHGTFGRIMVMLEDYQLEKTDLQKLIKRTDDIIVPRVTAFLEQFTYHPDYKEYLSEYMGKYAKWRESATMEVAVS